MAPVGKSQVRTVPSKEEDTIQRLSGLNVYKYDKYDMLTLSN